MTLVNRSQSELQAANNGHVDNEEEINVFSLALEEMMDGEMVTLQWVQVIVRCHAERAE